MMGNMMDMLGLDGYIEQIKPHATKLGAKCEKYAEQIKVRLEAIHDAVQDEDFLERREVVRVASIPSGGAPVEIVDVPVDQDWMLECITVLSNTGVAIGRITLDTQDGWPVQVVVSTNFAQSFPGNNAMIQHGTTLRLATSSAGDIKVVAQFKTFDRNKPVRKALEAGQIVQEKDQPQIDQSTTRHVGMPTGGQPWQ